MADDAEDICPHREVRRAGIPPLRILRCQRLQILFHLFHRYIHWDREWKSFYCRDYP